MAKDVEKSIASAQAWIMSAHASSPDASQGVATIELFSSPTLRDEPLFEIIAGGVDIKDRPPVRRSIDLLLEKKARITIAT